MKNYIAMEIVKAEPQQKDEKAGYKVVYIDGYETWIEKAAFEAVCREITEAEYSLLHTHNSR